MSGCDPDCKAFWKVCALMKVVGLVNLFDQDRDYERYAPRGEQHPVRTRLRLCETEAASIFSGAFR